MDFRAAPVQALRWLLAACVVGAAPLSHAVQDCELNGDHVNPANGHTTAGKTGLMRCKERDTGELRREQELRNGAFVGLVRQYEDGKLRREHSVNDKGNQHGLAREFSPTGQLLRESTYDNGRTVGLSRSFHPEGALRRAAFHDTEGQERAVAEFNLRGQLEALRCSDRPVLAPAVDDAKLCGHGASTPAQVELFDARGTLRTRLALLAGQRVRAESLHPNGQVAVLQTSTDTDRTERRFSADGVPRKELQWRVSGTRSIRLREADFSERGTLVREQRWSPEGEALSDDSYYLNGQPRSKAAYTLADTQRVLDITEFHDNGQRRAQGRYLLQGRDRQVPMGTHQHFDEQGVRRAESTFDERGRVRRERVWAADGSVQRDDEVFEDGSRKAYTAR